MMTCLSTPSTSRAGREAQTRTAGCLSQIRLGCRLISPGVSRLPVWDDCVRGAGTRTAAVGSGTSPQARGPTSPWPARSPPLPRVLSAAGCTAEQLLPQIQELLHGSAYQVLIDGVLPEMYAALRKSLPGVQYHARARMLIYRNGDAPKPQKLPGTVALVTSGPSDQTLADQVKLAAEHLGCYVLTKGPLTTRNLPHLMSQLPVLEAADVIITVSGADPPLPGILINLLDAPVIAVPVTPPSISSSGGSSSMGSLQAMGTLLTTLSSSPPGVAVVDIDSPISAATLAARMLRATAARVNKLMAMSSLAAAMPEAVTAKQEVVTTVGETALTTNGAAAAAAAAASAAEGFNVGAAAWPMPMLSMEEEGGSSSSNGKVATNGHGSAYAAVTH